jgi:seryl-tRNA synthetase
VKITGSRFYLLRGDGARLQRALIAWMLDRHRRHGYNEVYPPFVVRQQTMYGAGQLPKFTDNLYHDVDDDLWLVPTAEVPLTGMHSDEILDEADLPRRYTAYTPCFRREKMSAGRDVRGIKRGHQFDKVEMYVFCAPENSPAELERMLAEAEATCTDLGLTHRVKALCAGDLGFSAQDLRRRGLGARGGGMAGSLFGFHLRRFPGAPVRDTPPPGRRQGALPSHFEWFGPGPAAHDDRRAGDLPASRRKRRRPRGSASMDGRPGCDPPRGALTFRPRDPATRR